MWWATLAADTGTDLTDVLVNAVKSSWPLLLVVYMLSPEPVKAVLGKLLQTLGLKPKPKPEPVPGPDNTPAKPDWLELLMDLIRMNDEQQLGADEELKQLLAKTVGSTTKAARSRTTTSA